MSLKENKSGEIKSRMQKREQKKQRKATLVENANADKRNSKHENREGDEKIRIRLFPIWLRILIIVVLFVLFVIIGAVIGYSVIGDGSFLEVFQKSTWTNIIDLVEKE